MKLNLKNNLESVLKKSTSAGKFAFEKGKSAIKNTKEIYTDLGPNQLHQTSLLQIGANVVAFGTAFAINPVFGLCYAGIGGLWSAGNVYIASTRGVLDENKISLQKILSPYL